jgi:autotransporter translocation and assembly factor TamB
MRVARRIAHALLLVLTLLVGATAAAIIVTQTAWFKNWLRGYIVSEANNYLNGQLSIQRLGGNLFFGVELEDIGISMDGSQVVAVQDLGLDYNVFELITKGLSVDSVRLNKPTIYLRRDGDTWSIAKLVKKQPREADRQGPGSPISIDEIGISDASVVIADPVGTSGVEIPQRFDRIDAKLAFKYEPVRYSIEISHVSFRATRPEIGLNALSGGVSVKDDTLFVDKLALRTEESSILIDGAVQQYLTSPQLNLQVSSDKLSIPEIARVVPSLAGVNLQPAFEVKVDGPLDRLAVDMNVRSTAGQVTGQFVTGVQAPGQSVRGDIRVRHLDLATLLKNASQPRDLTADVHADVKAASLSDINSLRGSAALTVPAVRAAGYEARSIKVKADIAGRRLLVEASAGAYGAQATARGTVMIPQGDTPFSFDLRGRASHLNAGKLPGNLNVPPADTDVTADYHATGVVPKAASERRIDADATFAESTVPGARIAAGSSAGVSVRGQALDYRADMTVNGVDLQQLGRAFNVQALGDDKYSSNINAHVTASGSGTTLEALNVTANGTVNDSTVLGAKVPQLAFDATVADDTAHVTANLQFADLDPAAATGKAAMKGTVAGSLNADATIERLSGGVTPDSVAGSAHVTLEPSTVGAVAIQSAHVDADYREQVADVRTFEVVGRDANLKAQGTLALNETGQSNLTYHADSPRVAEIGKLFDVPVSGIASVDGTITGNRAELHATGTVVADGLEYQGNGALAINSKYTVDVPDLTFDRAAVQADTSATFVTVGGQNLDELSATTTFENKTVSFDATARQPQRSLNAAGSVVLQPDHQEVHITALTLTSGQRQWAAPAGNTATINYASDAITVDGLRLTSGPQQIEASGRFGGPGDALNLTLKDIDLAGVDALLLRPPQFSGTLNATAGVSGSKAAPEVNGNFQINQGGFRQFRYDTFGGTVSYVPAGITLDTRLQQNATQWITARGYLPSTLFSGSTAGANDRSDGHIEAATPADRVDLTIDSSPLDLGLVQGFTTALTKVTGSVEAHLRVTGSAEDPHPEGSLQIANGGVTIEPTGGVYTNIAGKIDLQPDRVHIDQITILDNRQNALSITGDLAVHQREVGAFQIWVNSDDFKVLDNKMGNVRLQSAVSLSGQLRSPIVQGYLGISTGQIDLDQIIAMIGSSPYATQQTQYDSGNTTAAIAQATPAPSENSPFNAMRMNVSFTVPNDLVVKASSLQTPGSPVSLGALNVTLGGDLTVIKDPGGPIRISGPVNTIRGNYDFQGRRFEILRDGSIRFEGLDQLNPALDLRTRRVIQGIEARVNIRGTLQKPEIVLTSTPPLEQADILSLIIFNQPANQLGAGQQVSLAQQAQSIAAGAVAGQLANSIGRALNLDTFEINAAPQTGGGPQVTVGQQVSQNLYVKVQQGISDISTTNVVLEYEIARWLRLQTNFMQGTVTPLSVFTHTQGSGADLIFTFSY